MISRTTNEALRPDLVDISTQLGITLQEAEADHLISYIALLQQWNATYNLTAVREPERMLTQHLADCLAIIQPLRRQLGTRLQADPAVRALDVGSGGGLPGVVIAIMFPHVDVTCVDTVGKKVAFIQQVAARLKLRNLHAEHARVERLKVLPFELITARAFASLSVFVASTRNLLAADTGIWLAMKGKDPVDERACLGADIEVFHVEQLHVPRLDAERCLVWMRPGHSL